MTQKIHSSKTAEYLRLKTHVMSRESNRPQPALLICLQRLLDPDGQLRKKQTRTKTTFTILPHSQRRFLSVVFCNRRRKKRAGGGDRPPAGGASRSRQRV